MYIVMHCAGMPFHGNTIYEKSLGGSETAAYYMALELHRLGADVSIFTNIQPSEEGTYDGVKYLSIGNRNDHSPMGDRFEFYAQNTPHDVCIIQRDPRAFARKYASRINLWWVHDLALIRQSPMVQQQLWNIDGILTVSEFHKEQYADVYGIEKSVIFPIENGVDPKLYQNALPVQLDQSKKHLVYISRPERGLEHLVKQGGIMDQLGDGYTLHLCAYDNTTQDMAQYYNMLWNQAAQNPNIINHGPLNKNQLASLLKAAHLMVYPTPSSACPGFEEVSCIAMMEAMHTDTPVVTSAAGALPETCADAGIVLVPLKDGLPDVDQFVAEIRKMFADQQYYDSMVDKQWDAAQKYSWTISAHKLLKTIDELSSRNLNTTNVIVDSIRHSDYYVAEKMMREYIEGSHPMNQILQAKQAELEECYSFTKTDDWRDHYEAFYRSMEAIGKGARPEDMGNNSRYLAVSNHLGDLAGGSRVLDFGCAHGHYTINLAKRFPDCQFIGVDFSEHNIEVAQKWAADAGVGNVSFVHGGEEQIDQLEGEFDRILCAEVLEHVARPWELADALASKLKQDGEIVFTTPFGAWEADSYMDRWPFREHLWHFDRNDIKKMFGHHPGYKLTCAPCGMGPDAEIRGSFVFKFAKDLNDKGEQLASNEVDLYAKCLNIIPRQTVALCMIVREAEASILRCLKSVAGHIDEVVIGFDPAGDNEECERIVSRFCEQNRIPFLPFDLTASPLEQGFDAARNETLDAVTADWILWLDSDEEMVFPENMAKYLRNNQFAGYAMKQDHYSSEPAGILKTDYPVKLFRNHHGIKFYGRVHEHPEKALNEGVGKADILPDLYISHYGYDTEATRRKRFQRNIALLERDRADYPDRTLGKMLWARDLYQISRYEYEATRQLGPQVAERAKEVRAIFRDLLGENLRMAIDCLEYYTALNQLTGEGFWFSFAVSGDLMRQPDLSRARKIEAFWSSKEDLDMVLSKLSSEITENYKHRYF